MVKSIRVMIAGLLLLFGVHSFTTYHNFDFHDIYYDNVRYSDNVEFYGVDGMKLQYSGNLSYVGDYYELFFDVVNASSVDVMISDYVVQEDDSYIHYELTYEDGCPIQDGDILPKGEAKTLHYKVLYEEPIKDEAYEMDSSFLIHYEQKI